MISAIVTILYTVALIVASFFYLKARYHLCENDSLRDVAKKNIKYLIQKKLFFIILVKILKILLKILSWKIMMEKNLIFIFHL